MDRMGGNEAQPRLSATVHWSTHMPQHAALLDCRGEIAGRLRGKRAAAIMSLIQSARLNGHDPYAYLKDVLTRLPTQRASEISHLLPHEWTPNRAQLK
ncbi:putative transposase [Pseudomonas syringae pv. pisi]|nr:putative transposase [Pseudomonas syringae pv. pisi]